MTFFSYQIDLGFISFKHAFIRIHVNHTAVLKILEMSKQTGNFTRTDISARENVDFSRLQMQIRLNLT